MKEIKLVEVKSGLGGRYAGACLGIDAIHIAACAKQEYSVFFNRFAKNKTLYSIINSIINNADALFSRSNIIHKYSKYIEKLIPIHKKTADEVSLGVTNCDFVVVLSGDHSSAGGTIAGIKQACPEKQLGVVWIDAHADIHSPYTSDSGNMHGMPLNTTINDDNLENKINELDVESANLWEEIKNIGGTKSKINPTNLVYVALRDYEPAEAHIINKYNIKVITTQELRNNNATNTAKYILNYLANCDIIYVSFDVDSMDTSVSVGTGTPSAGGLYDYEAKELLYSLVQSHKVKCVEISEVNPTLDIGNKMAEIALELLYTICQTVDNR